jgi:hypothetical protein
MPRTYSDDFLLTLHKYIEDDPPPGIRLAKLCVDANVPMTLVAEYLGVTKLAVFYWFRGSGIRAHRIEAVMALADILERDLKSGRLPVRNLPLAKVYFASLRQ